MRQVASAARDPPLRNKEEEPEGLSVHGSATLLKCVVSLSYTAAAPASYGYVLLMVIMIGYQKFKPSFDSLHIAGADKYRRKKQTFKKNAQERLLLRKLSSHANLPHPCLCTSLEREH